MNGPRSATTWLIKEAGNPLGTARFPVLVGIERFGPIGGRRAADPTASGEIHHGQSSVAKMESPGRVKRQGSAADRAVREASSRRRAPKEMTIASTPRATGSVAPSSRTCVCFGRRYVTSMVLNPAVLVCRPHSQTPLPHCVCVSPAPPNRCAVTGDLPSVS